MVSFKNEAADDNPSALIVDDLVPNLEAFKEIFIDAGFKVYSAQNAVSAIRIFKTNRIDIAVVDVFMPDMDGYELCNRIKKLSGRHFFPVILVTAFNDRESKIKGLECGADDFLIKPFDSIELITKTRSLIKLRRLYDDLEHSENIIFTLAVAMESREPYTKGHSKRVGNIAKSFASYLGFGENEQEQLRKSGILHDIGKIGVDRNVLCKKGRLNPDELKELRRHTIVGEEICKPLVSMREALPSIRSHHERWDGRGFPDGKSGESIPLYSRMLSIVDSFDAMVSERPYREKMSIHDSLDVFEVERDHGQWDPYLVEQFICMINQIGADKMGGLLQ